VDPNIFREWKFGGKILLIFFFTIKSIMAAKNKGKKILFSG
jgi:hypothetical protein